VINFLPSNLCDPYEIDDRIFLTTISGAKAAIGAVLRPAACASQPATGEAELLSRE
jgi:hypothetical protein